MRIPAFVTVPAVINFILEHLERRGFEVRGRPGERLPMARKEDPKRICRRTPADRARDATPVALTIVGGERVSPRRQAQVV